MICASFAAKTKVCNRYKSLLSLKPWCQKTWNFWHTGPKIYKIFHLSTFFDNIGKNMYNRYVKPPNLVSLQRFVTFHQRRRYHLIKFFHNLPPKMKKNVQKQQTFVGFVEVVNKTNSV